MKDGEISLTERFARQQYVYPRRIYEGMEFFIDMDAAAEQSTWIQTEFDIDFHKIRELYCPAGSTYISAISPEIEEILKKLWSLLDISVPLSIMQMKIYTLALFSLLQNLKEIPPSQACTFFTETQVDIAKRVEKIITSDTCCIPPQSTAPGGSSPWRAASADGYPLPTRSTACPQSDPLPP